MVRSYELGDGLGLLAGGEVLSLLVLVPLGRDQVGCSVEVAGGGGGDDHGDLVETGGNRGERAAVAVLDDQGVVVVAVGVDRLEEAVLADAGDQVVGSLGVSDVRDESQLGGADVDEVHRGVHGGPFGYGVSGLVAALLSPYTHHACMVRS